MCDIFCLLLKKLNVSQFSADRFPCKKNRWSVLESLGNLVVLTKNYKPLYNRFRVV